MARPAVPARGYRPSACPLRRPYGFPRDQKECGGMKIARLARAAPRRALAPGGWWSSGPGGVGPGPPWAVAGLPRSAPAGCAARPKTGGNSPPPKWSASKGPGLGALRAARRAVWPFPPWRLCGRWGRFCRPGWGGQPLACPGPSPALVNIGRGPPVARRQGGPRRPQWVRSVAAASPGFLRRPGAAKGGGHVGPPPSEASAARGAGVWIPPPAGGGERPGA